MTEIIEKDEEKIETIPPKEVPPKEQEPSQTKKEPKSRIEKLRHTKASIEAQIAEEEKANGIVISSEDDDDKPLTKGDLKRMQRDEAKKTALQLANNIQDEDERAAVIENLQTAILPSGNPQKDFQKAVDLANSEKNRQIAALKEQNKGKSKPVKSGGGAPAKEEDQFVPTENELAAAAMVGKKTPEAIKAFVLKARAKEQRQQ